MRYLTAVGLFAAISLLVLASDKTAPAKSDRAGAEQTLIQIEQEWNRALMAKDIKTVDKIMAEDWTGIDFRGVTMTKAESIEELKSGESGNASVELGDMTVKVFGSTAVVIGSDTEKSTYHGQDSSGRYAWMDVFVKRAGRWQAVASQSTKIAK
jgi:ketosteroid isomerase-like protein